MKIENAVALVTGANGGLGGHWIQGLLNSEVSKIYACARNTQKLESIIATYPAKIIAIELDITDESSIIQAALQCPDVTLLINNAGILLNQGLIASKDLSAAKTEIEINYLGTLAMCRAFAPILKMNGGGAIINMLTMLAKANLPANGSYCASKAATFSMTQGVRAELANQKTLVIGVMPGTIDTGMSKDYPPPKVPPTEVVKDALQAVMDGVEDVYPGEQAKELAAQLLSDPKALEKALAQMLPVS
ncbi:SDR family oxidoreductase [Brunnivagina elsteri]|uniref:Short-chain dehydrogenase n=1 Tax=Brunnivagina elsteri CCALA 953 TaxID=987040 RepID=A0A2A2TJW4_9CYAN|nr:SDR family oxidoreductase [Calothrix elsteri]PAX55199.1 short-chain dehydrogenase [Calothrix elsteri CCALA 953]